jgi:uncharacterized membrane protein
MTNQLSRTYLEAIALVLEAAGVLAIVAGAIFALYAAVRSVRRKEDEQKLFETFRTRLAKSILVGLEFLVAADIVGTVIVQPTLQSLGILALIVLIRTFLSFSLEVEIEGRWPWERQRSRTEDR